MANLFLENWEAEEYKLLIKTLLNADWTDDNSPLYLEEGTNSIVCGFCHFNVRDGSSADYPKGHDRNCPVHMAYNLDRTPEKIT